MNAYLAVYDQDCQYAERFADYINNRDKMPFSVIAFTGMDQLIGYLGEHLVPLVVLEAGTPAAGVTCEQIIFLTEVRGENQINGYAAIYKYQSMDVIIKEIMALYYEETQKNDIPGQARNSKILGVYSPIHRCLKTSFALAFGQLISKERKTLYLNLEEYSGFTSLICEDNNGTLSDLIYFYQQDLCSASRITALTQTWGDLDYIPPICYPDDLLEISAQHLASMIQVIAAESYYECIIVDAGPLGRQIMAILELCHVIYMPIKEDTMSMAKLAEFESYLKACRKDDLLNRIQYLKLPYYNDFGRKGNYLEQLLWGELGDYIRTLIKGNP